MLISVLIRFARFVIASVVVSFPVMLVMLAFDLRVYLPMIVSFTLFTAFIAVDSFKVSEWYPSKKDFLAALLIPYALFVLLTVLCFWLGMPAKVYNYLFLPLRIPEIFNAASKHSIIFVHIFILIVMLIMNFIGRLARKSQDRKHS